MIRPLREIKEEIRILGLDTCNPRLSVGVVARGGLYLDGVISFPPNRNNTMRECARRIVDSAYFPELRAVMLHNPNGERDSRSLERITGLPTIAISIGEPRHGRGYRVFRGNPGRLWVKTRVELTILKKILTVSWIIGKLPEPLRVAHLLASLDLPDMPG
ncbi:MAG TPA: hypothetical protein VNA15_07165 [Candidatus Angelobacter sp.]|nr:hypothetical protein [Candidatus Angelobacter sp.]